MPKHCKSRSNPTIVIKILRLGVVILKYLVACFPKSGSTYLTELIGKLEGFSKVSWVPAYGHREQELDEQIIASSHGSTYQVAQHHVRASDHSLDIIHRQNITPIVLVRNIFDCMISLADHTEHQTAVYPMAFIQDHLRTASFEERIEAIVDLASPWYINFFASWYLSRPMNIVRYEDLVIGSEADKAKWLARFGLLLGPEAISSAADRIQPTQVRFNVGVAGRGLDLLSAPQIDRIRQLTKHYRGIDFSLIGL